MAIIHDSQSVKEDIASLRQSISHLSSVLHDTGRISVVKGTSILNNEELRSSTDEDYMSLPLSSDCSHNEIVLRNNICKLKRDISRRIMSNKHLFKIVNHYPSKREQNLDYGFRMSCRDGESGVSSIISVIKANKISSSLEDLTNNDVLNRIESNISSWIPSYENTSMFDEKKSSLCLPDFNPYNFRKEASKENLSPKAMKRRLNSDIEKCHFLENLS